MRTSPCLELTHHRTPRELLPDGAVVHCADLGLTAVSTSLNCRWDTLFIKPHPLPSALLLWSLCLRVVCDLPLDLVDDPGGLIETNVPLHDDAAIIQGARRNALSLILALSLSLSLSLLLDCITSNERVRIHPSRLNVAVPPQLSQRGGYQRGTLNTHFAKAGI